jgi:hypothetical protein
MDGDVQAQAVTWLAQASNAWSSAGACATSLHQPAVCMLAAYIICHRLQAAGPRLRPDRSRSSAPRMCVSCALRIAVPARWHVFVCQYFIKAVALHASPHSSWTRSTTVRPVAAHIEPTDSASGRTDRRRRYKETSPVGVNTSMGVLPDLAHCHGVTSQSVATYIQRINS